MATSRQLAAALDPEAVFPGHRVRLPRSSDRLTEARDQAFARQFEKVMSRLARRKLQVGSRVAANLKNIHVIVNHDAGRAMRGQHQAVGFSQHVERGPALGCSLRAVDADFGIAVLAREKRRRARGRRHAIDLVGSRHLMK